MSEVVGYEYQVLENGNVYRGVDSSWDRARDAYRLGSGERPESVLELQQREVMKRETVEVLE